MDRKMLKELLERNPQVDAKQLQQAMDALRRLRRAGFRKHHGYNLLPPFTRRRSNRCAKHPADDPRSFTVRF